LFVPIVAAAILVFVLARTRWGYELMRARGNSIEGGTTEILKNIVAERVLGLPRMR